VDYTHPLIAQDTDCDAVARRLVEALVGEGLPFVANHWDTGDPGAQAFLRAALDQGFQVTTAPRSVAYDTLPDSPGAFAQQLPTATRRNRTRYYQREGWLEDGEFTLLTFRDLGGILAQFPVIERFSRATHGRLSIWRLPWYVDFLRSCVRASSGHGWPLAWTLYRGTDPVASALGWVMGGHCTVSALTHDRACRDVEPGHILLTRVIGELIGQGVRRLDMHTAEGYKTHYLRQRRLRLDPLLLCPPGVSPDWALAAMFGLSGLRRLARSVLVRSSPAVRAAD
jgi:CelD/BcsL family acetyltransferase involved in cellulose biosynthesis